MSGLNCNLLRNCYKAKTSQQIGPYGWGVGGLLDPIHHRSADKIDTLYSLNLSRRNPNVAKANLQHFNKSAKVENAGVPPVKVHAEAKITQAVAAPVLRSVKINGDQ